jgi:hypothetical protein
MPPGPKEIIDYKRRIFVRRIGNMFPHGPANVVLLQIRPVVSLQSEQESQIGRRDSNFPARRQDSVTLSEHSHSFSILEMLNQVLGENISKAGCREGQFFSCIDSDDADRFRSPVCIQPSVEHMPAAADMQLPQRMVTYIPSDHYGS